MTNIGGSRPQKNNKLVKQKFKGINNSQVENILEPIDCYTELEKAMKFAKLDLIPKYKRNYDGFFNCKLSVTVGKAIYSMGPYRGRSKEIAKEKAAVLTVLMFIHRENNVVKDIEKWVDKNEMNLEVNNGIESLQMSSKDQHNDFTEHSFREREFQGTVGGASKDLKRKFRNYLFENIRESILQKCIINNISISDEVVDSVSIDSRVARAHNMSLSIDYRIEEALYLIEKHPKLWGQNRDLESVKDASHKTDEFSNLFKEKLKRKN